MKVTNKNIFILFCGIMLSLLLAAGVFTAEAGLALAAEQPRLLAQSLAPGDVPTDPNAVISNVTNYLVGISGAVAVLFLIIGGVRYTTSMGNEQAKEKAKTTILRAVVGLVIIIAAYLIVTAVIDALM
jgi:hypothetical protein